MLGLLCAVLAFVGQLSFGTINQAEAAQATQIAALAAAGIDCHASPASDPRHRTPHPHHKADPALGPLRLVLAPPGFTLSPPATTPAPRVAALATEGMPPPACGPPPATARVGKPRAPPVPT